MDAALLTDRHEASMGLGVPGPEVEIRRLIADWEDALCSRNLERLMAFYCHDVVLFDVHPPFRVEGIERVRELWEDALPLIPQRLECRNLRIVADLRAAFAHWCFRPEGAVDRPVVPVWIRVSAGYRKVGGHWKIAHEHVSLPVDPISNQAVSVTELL